MVVTLDEGSFLQLFVVHVSEPLISCVDVGKQFHLNQCFTMMHYKWLQKGAKEVKEGVLSLQMYMPSATYDGHHMRSFL
jgi:hypothetical protein